MHLIGQHRKHLSQIRATPLTPVCQVLRNQRKAHVGGALTAQQDQRRVLTQRRRIDDVTVGRLTGGRQRTTPPGRVPHVEKV
jgi:hypothetical protein